MAHPAMGQILDCQVRSSYLAAGECYAAALLLFEESLRLLLEPDGERSADVTNWLCARAELRKKRSLCAQTGEPSACPADSGPAVCSPALFGGRGTTAAGARSAGTLPRGLGRRLGAPIRSCYADGRWGQSRSARSQKRVRWISARTFPRGPDRGVRCHRPEGVGTSRRQLSWGIGERRKWMCGSSFGPDSTRIAPRSGRARR